jgi:hypothetical protein
LWIRIRSDEKLSGRILGKKDPDPGSSGSKMNLKEYYSDKLIKVTIQNAHNEKYFIFQKFPSKA